jgi:hypothetical protein
MARIVIEILVGATFAAVSLAVACSSSSGGAGSGAEDSGSETSDYLVEAGPPWCLTNEAMAVGQVDECSRSVQTCLSGQSAAASCPTANLAGCCKGTANSLGGEGSEVCIYEDDYLAADGGAESWCTCQPQATPGCFGGTWQTSP